MAALLHDQGANPFRVRAYRRGADAVRHLARPVSEILDAEGLDGLERLPDIGLTLARAIRDIVRLGYSPMLARLRGEITPSISWRRCQELADGSRLGWTRSWGSRHWRTSKPRPTEQIAAVWNDAIARTMQAGFLATERAHAAETYGRVANLLDDYGRRWVAARVDACEATHKRGEQSEKMLDLRMVCLTNKLHRMEALVQALTGKIDAATVDGAISTTLALPSLDSCADVAALTRAYPLPSGEAERRAIKKVEAFLDRIETQLDMGQGNHLLESAEDAKARADATGYPPVQTRAALLLAQVQELNTRYKEAEASFQAAAQVAAKAHEDESIARAWIDLVNIVGYRQGRIDDALSIIPFAETAIARADDDAMLYARLARSLGWLYSASGDYRKTQVYHERALEILQSRYGANSLEATSSRLALSVTYGLAAMFEVQANYDQALAHYERIRDIVETHFGPEHVYMVSVLGPMAENLSKRGELDAATAQYRRALEIDRANGSPNKATMAALLVKFAQNLLRQEKLEEAQQMLEQALALRIEVFGTEHSHTAEAMRSIADVLIRRDAYDEADEMLTRTGRIYEASVGTGHQDYAEYLLLQAELSMKRGQPSTAIERYQQVLSIMQAANAARHPIAARALVGLGEIMRRRGDNTQALQHLTQALAILEGVHGARHARVDEVRNTMAEVLLAEQRYAEARDLLERVRQSLENAPGTQSAHLARTLTSLAESHLGLQEPAAALPLAQRALDIWERHASKTADAGWARFVLARSLWQVGGDRTQALRLAREARTLLDGSSHAMRSAAVDAWLARVSSGRHEP